MANTRAESLAQDIVLKIRLLTDMTSMDKASKRSQRAMDDIGRKAGRTGKDVSRAFDAAAADTEKSGKRVGDAFGKAFDTAKSKGYVFRGWIDKALGPLGISLSIGALIRSGHQLNMEIRGWHNSFRSLSDATGDTSQAVDSMQSIWKKTSSSLTTVQSVMQSLGQHGLPVANREFESMAKFIADVNQSSGISADALASLTAGLNQMYNVSFKATREMASSLMALGDGFRFTNTQIELMMKTTEGVANKLGAFFDDVDSGMRGLAKGIGSASAAMHGLGVSAQSAGGFLENVMDPERINENMALFSRLGISYQETLNMMTESGGQEAFLEKMMRNLPELSRQITAIRNPMARLQFSKSLGMPLEIAQKMAKGTRSEIEGIMQDYKKKAKEEKATEKKKQRMTEDAQRFDNALHFMKMNALLPMINFANRHLPAFLKFFGDISERFKGVSGKIAEMLDPLAKNVLPAVTRLLDGDFKGFWESLSVGLKDAFVQGARLLAAAIPEAMGGAMRLAWEGFKQLWSTSKLAAIGVGLFGAFKAAGFVKNVALAAMQARWHYEGQPVTIADGGGGGGRRRDRLDQRDNRQHEQGVPDAPRRRGRRAVKGAAKKGKGKGKLLAIAAAAGGSLLAGDMISNLMDSGAGAGGNDGGDGISDMLDTASTAAAFAPMAIGIGKKAAPKIGKIGAKAGAKVAGSAALKAGARLGAKAIPGIGQALLIADALWSIGKGVAGAGEALGKKKGEKVTANERAMGGVAGLASALTLGIVDSATITKSMDSFAQRASGKFKFGKAEAAELSDAEKQLRDEKAGRIKLNKFYKESLELRVKRLKETESAAFTERDRVELKQNEDRLRLLTERGKRLTGREKLENDKLVAAMESNIKTLKKKQAQSTGLTDALYGLGGKIGKAMGLADTAAEMQLSIRRTFAGIADTLKWGWHRFGMMFASGLNGAFKFIFRKARKSLKKFGVNIEEFEFEKKARTSEETSKEAVAKIKEASNRLLGGGIDASGAITPEGKRQQAIMQQQIATLKSLGSGYSWDAEAMTNYVAELNERVNRLAKETREAAAAKRVEELKAREDAALAKSQGEQVVKNTAATAAHTKKAADELSSKDKAEKRIGYIDFWLRNQGFQGIAFKA